MFRGNPLYIVYLFDHGEKMEMHRTPQNCFLPDDVKAYDADEYCYMSETNTRCMESVWKKALSRGRRGIASASERIGKPTVFQTETMNESDMPELRKSSYRLFEGGALFVDDVSTATLYKVRQIAILENVLPRTGLKGIEYGSIRLEIQSGRSYRLHAHNMIRTYATETVLFDCISASMESLPPSVRDKYSPLSRHQCLSYKCNNGNCVYGYPVLEACDRTKRVFDEDKQEDRIVYKRRVGRKCLPCDTHGEKECEYQICRSANNELDERVTPFCVELTHVRNCHGAFLVCDDELATGYSGKYAFKRSGGLGTETGRVSMFHSFSQRQVQLLQKDKNARVNEALKEYLSVRTVSMMEMCLHLSKESVVYNTFYLRELWIVLPHERKRYIQGGVIHRGIAGSAQLRDYYRRDTAYEKDTFEEYYSRSEIKHPSDAENGVRCAERDGDGVEYVYVGRQKKRLITRIMPIRGEGRRLAELSSWFIILSRVSHRRVDSVWNVESGEELWDAAARCGALGQEHETIRGTAALMQILQVTLDREIDFSTRMGMKEEEKEKIKAAFEFACDSTLRMGEGSNELIACTENDDGNLQLRVTDPVTSRPDIFDDETGVRDNVDHIERLAREEWRNRFRARGWKISDDDSAVCIILSIPAEVRKELQNLLPYQSQARACVEILDAIVRSPRGVKRFISGAAGRGKSFLKKTIIRILRSAGLNVKVLAVAAIVAQDDETGEGSTIASAFNRRVSDNSFDMLALEHAKTDVFLFDEVSLASKDDARAMTEYLSRGEYMKSEGYLLHYRSRKRRLFREMLAPTDDPYFGANIIMLGDFMQLAPPGGEPIYASERLWGNVFRSNTLILRECVRTSDMSLLRLSDISRSFSGDDLDTGREIVRIVRSRAVNQIEQVPPGTAVLSPRFKRAQDFCELALESLNNNDEVCRKMNWGTEILSIDSDDYVVRNRKVALDDCIGMDNKERLEAKKAVLDKDHTRLRKFVFRIGMTAVVTENGSKTGVIKGSIQESEWPDSWNGNSKQISSNESPTDPGGVRSGGGRNLDRLLNGERVKILGVVKKQDLVYGVKIQSTEGRWRGQRVMKKTASKCPGLKTSSALESRSVRFMRNGKEETGRVTRSQVPLCLEMGLTVHKSQGMTLSDAVIDLGCGKGAYVGGLFYTAITRVRSLEKLWFIDTPDSDDMILEAVRCCTRSMVEMNRCENDSKDVENRSYEVLQQMIVIIEQ